MPIGGKIIQVNGVAVSSRTEIVGQLKTAGAGPVAFTCTLATHVQSPAETEPEPEPEPELQAVDERLVDDRSTWPTVSTEADLLAALQQTEDTPVETVQNPTAGGVLERPPPPASEVLISGRESFLISGRESFLISGRESFLISGREELPI
eukprot:COSAG06_NODE_782_length_12363_cov_27.005463_9_plen_151_part_00